MYVINQSTLLTFSSSYISLYIFRVLKYIHTYILRPCSVPARSPDPTRKMDAKPKPKPEQKPPQAETTTNEMDSFGEGYSTRAEEEGYGGIYGYGGNQSFLKDNTNESEKNQGSEVKEKERGRQQNQLSFQMPIIHKATSFQIHQIILPSIVSAL
ncbi:uncharacterized protein LOC127258269 [Andrographis paniculata]|uniref:uncharacterized protein LOC127258269 n=1 Tax=Andrographis paniculata TaxID=175694 RepID=UPI0021E84DAA|nr:uncharacterized protein LOC127258269 [Andrographis paniculata]